MPLSPVETIKDLIIDGDFEEFEEKLKLKKHQKYAVSSFTLFAGAAAALHYYLYALAGTAIFIGLGLFACYRLIKRYSGDDDDEAYFALFNPASSPVATPHAFAAILQRTPRGSSLLDIGVGSATYLEHAPVRKLIKDRDLHIVGVDISVPNVAISVERIQKHKLEKNFEARVQDVRQLWGTRYDAILFMEVRAPALLLLLLLRAHGWDCEGGGRH